MDIVKEPNHYQTNNRESIEIMKDMSTTEEFEGFLKLTAHKYLYRYNSKGNGIEDLQKAQQYIEGLINLKKYPDCDNVFRINYEEAYVAFNDSIASEKEFGEVFHERLTDLLTDLPEVFEESPETLGVVESKLEQALEETKELQREETETESTPEHILIIYGKGFTDTRKRMKELDTDKYDEVYLIWNKDTVHSIFLENADNFVHLEGVPFVE